MRSLPTLGILFLERYDKAFSPIQHLWALQMRWVSSYPFLQVRKLRKWLVLPFTRKFTYSAGKRALSFCVLVHSSIRQAITAYRSRAMCCCCCSSCRVSMCRFALLYSPSTQFSLWFQMFLLLLHSHSPVLRALYFPFLFLPPPSFSYVSNYLDSILIYKMCCQYHSGALKTLPEQRCPLD